MVEARMNREVNPNVNKTNNAMRAALMDTWPGISAESCEVIILGFNYVINGWQGRQNLDFWGLCLGGGTGGVVGNHFLGGGENEVK